MRCHDLPDFRDASDFCARQVNISLTIGLTKA
jgi:hypothetical protein